MKSPRRANDNGTSSKTCAVGGAKKSLGFGEIIALKDLATKSDAITDEQLTAFKMMALLSSEKRCEVMQMVMLFNVMECDYDKSALIREELHRPLD